MLKCQSIQSREKQNVGEGKANMGGRKMGSLGGAKKKGEQLKEIVGLVGEPSEVLARTVGDGVRKMMKKREEEKR